MSNGATLLGDGFVLRFVRRGDRYVQLIEVEQGGGYECVAESIEGTGDELWPASPPLQDLHLEQREGGVQVALLVGRAGRSHWSLSVELDPAGRELRFDAACRTTDKPQRLGSTYQLMHPSRIGWECSEGTYAACEADRLMLSSDLQAIRGSQTVRWQYRFMVHGPEGMV